LRERVRLPKPHGSLKLLLCLSLAALALACTRFDRSSAEHVRPAPGDVAPAREPSYWADVRPILARHCTGCHAEGGLGPMRLDRFEDAKTHAGDVAFQTRERHMPPWLPDTSSCAPLRHARSLPEGDVATLERWAAIGAPEGERSASARLSPAAASERAPDLVARVASGYVPARRPDDYRCFVVDPQLTSDRRITALRIRPGLPSIVHHVLLFEVRAAAVPKVEALDAKDATSGYPCFGGIGVAPSLRPGDPSRGQLVDFDAQMIVGWAPGAGATDRAGGATALPEGTALHLASGSRLVMQVHYHVDRPVTADRTSVEMWFAGDEPLRQAVWVPLSKYDFEIPPGVGPDDPRATARAEIALPLPLEIRGVAAHMHLRGRSIKVAADDGACLLDIPRWDFNHQEGYWLERGVRVSRARIQCTWDNRRQKNKRTLRWGEGTEDEMCLAFLYATI